MRQDLSSPRVLRAIAREPLTIWQIQERTGLNWSVVNAALHRLEARGEVCREREVGISPGRAQGRSDLWRKVA